MSEPIRLSKRVIELTQCSRSQAEQLIEGGWVKVDGQIVEKPHLLVQEEVIEIDPNAQPGPIEPATILLHRPALAPDDPAAIDPVLSAGDRWPDDRTGIRVLQRHLHHLTPLVPLEPAASGLVVLSQNDSLIRTIRRNGDRLEQEFLVEVTGVIPPDGLRRLAQEPRGDGSSGSRLKVSWQSEQRLRFAVQGVQPGEIVRLCASVELTAVAVKRVRLGSIPLARLQPGQWRYLDKRERL